MPDSTNRTAPSSVGNGQHDQFRQPQPIFVSFGAAIAQEQDAAALKQQAAADIATEIDHLRHLPQIQQGNQLLQISQEVAATSQNVERLMKQMAAM